MNVLKQAKTKKRVVVAMSGGVDSSVAAALLVEQGYDVVGMMMRLWSEPGMGDAAPANRCCTPDQMADARRVAGILNIPFYVVDVQDHFRQTVVQFFIDEHDNGRTPNPCIECNRQIRFTYLLERALALDASYLATGHYAQVRHTASGYQLLKGRDENKDQSYVLHVLNQEKLGQVLFPIGGYTKLEVRQLAQKFGLPVASKSESQDLCFLGDGNYRRFLQEYSQKASHPGPILNSHGQKLGQHNGLPFYTIGQRKGLGISVGEPLFVLRKDVAKNTLIVGSKSELGQQTLIARDVNWLNGQPPTGSVVAQIKIRYKAKGVQGVVIDLGNGRSQVTLHEPVFGITAGQGAIFYDGDVCLGGGIIADEPNSMEETACPRKGVGAVNTSVDTSPNTPSLQLAHIQVHS
ncbi:tRNA-specific 2-thiouridylase MnmA [hydrothermal vent metagenome]|uniref:tRNA-specific 2-thiouridylase MnmA n=1 Tax=hydrothermal vent metagenome TaxID=652676 RepID=A0A3B0VJI1_9ZZZZ